MKEISERIKLIRKCSHLSKEQFALNICVTADKLEQWEKDFISPSVEEILKISKIYNISTEFLLNGNTSECDIQFLNRKLFKDDLYDEIRKCFLTKLECDISAEMLDSIYDISQLFGDIFAKDINLDGKIFFDVYDLLEINNFDIYFDIKKNFQIKGNIEFKMLDPHKHSLAFYEEALKTILII